MKSSNSRIDPWPNLSLAYSGGNLPQSLLVVGPTPQGEPAIAWCQILLCEARGESNCLCRSCQKPLEDHPDLAILSPSPHTIKIDDVRSVLQSLGYRPLWASTRVVWIQEADKLGVDAANLLLKVLEEPAPFVHFVLTTEYPDRVLATIRSRCQKIHLPETDRSRRELGPDWMLARPLLPEHIVDAVWYVEEAFRRTHQTTWLVLWENLLQAHQALATNANQEVWRERIRQWWRLS